MKSVNVLSHFCATISFPSKAGEPCTAPATNCGRHCNSFNLNFVNLIAKKCIKLSGTDIRDSCWTTEKANVRGKGRLQPWLPLLALQ